MYKLSQTIYQLPRSSVSKIKLLALFLFRAEKESRWIIETKSKPINNPFDTPQKRIRYSRDDKGMSALFADQNQHRCRWIDERNCWYIYTGKVWRPDKGGKGVFKFVREFVEDLVHRYSQLYQGDEYVSWIKFASKYCSLSKMNALRDLGADLHMVSINDFDKNPKLLNLENGTYNLKNGKFWHHRPEDLLTRIANVTYRHDACCHRWLKFIDEIMEQDADKALFLQKALAYGLSGETNHECFFVLYGNKTRNGKGTLMSTIVNIMGSYSEVVQPESVMQKYKQGSTASPDIAKLKGARLVNISEPPRGSRFDEALMKQLTGRDPVTARFLNENEFTYTPQFKIYINTNHRVVINDPTLITSGRVREVPFNRTFEENEQDKGLKDYFQTDEAKAGILNWLLHGYRRMQQEGLKNPQSVEDSIKDYKAESDKVGQFKDEWLVEQSGAKTKIKDIYKTYESWCSDMGITPLGSLNFRKELELKGVDIRRSTGNQPFVYGYSLSCPCDNPFIDTDMSSTTPVNS